MNPKKFALQVWIPIIPLRSYVGDYEQMHFKDGGMHFSKTQAVWLKAVKIWALK